MKVNNVLKTTDFPPTSIDQWKLSGLISIGDVVKSQHASLTMENH